MLDDQSIRAYEGLMKWHTSRTIDFCDLALLGCSHGLELAIVMAYRCSGSHCPNFARSRHPGFLFCYS